MQPRPSPIFLLFLMLFIALPVAYCQYASFAQTQTLELKYNDLLGQIEKGNIASIIIHNDGHVQGRFKEVVDVKPFFVSNISPSLIGGLTEKLYSQPGPKSEIIFAPADNGSPFLTLLFMGVGFMFLFYILSAVSKKGMGGMNSPMSYLSSKAKLFNHQLTNTTFKDVAGIDEAKEELQEIIEFLKDPGKFQKLGGKIPKGVLLVGSPGSGKTLLAKAVAGEAKVPFFYTSGSSFIEMFVGVGAGRVRDLFDQAGKKAPCIIFIDELDAVGRQRGNGLGGGGHDEREQTLNQILTEMDGFDSNHGVIVIGATNRPDVLDEALLRPGRFDRQVVVDRPDVKGRLEILTIHSNKTIMSDKADLKAIAKGTPGFSGADLANLINEAALHAARKNKEQVDTNDLEFAKDKVMMGLERKSMVISDKEKHITAVHEAGHAIVAFKTPGADPLHKVTIIPRGRSMGSTWQLPEEDRHNYTRTHLSGQLAILMAGRIAEEVMIGEVTTGASNDIERATDIARRMVCDWGMSELGPLHLGIQQGNPFLGKQTTEINKNFSENMTMKIEDEIVKLVEKARTEATLIIIKGRKNLEALAHKLMEKEILDHDEIALILKES